jgi:hypothetical protein
MTKVSIEKHPEDVIDVAPEVLSSMSRRLKQTPKQRAKALDDEIARLFHANFSGVQIPIMSLTKIYQAARLAAGRGENMLEAMAAVVNSVKV